MNWFARIFESLGRISVLIFRDVFGASALTHTIPYLVAGLTFQALVLTSVYFRIVDITLVLSPALEAYWLGIRLADLFFLDERLRSDYFRVLRRSALFFLVVLLGNVSLFLVHAPWILHCTVIFNLICGIIALKITGGFLNASMSIGASLFTLSKGVGSGDGERLALNPLLQFIGGILIPLYLYNLNGDMKNAFALFGIEVAVGSFLIYSMFCGRRLQ